MVKLFCPECGGKIKRKIKYVPGEIRKETIDSLIIPSITLGNHSYDAFYSCKDCDYTNQKYFKYVSGHEDFETGDMFTGTLSKYGFIGKTLISILIFLPLVAAAIFAGVISGNVMVVYLVVVMGTMCGYGFPMMFIVCAWMDHSGDQAKLRELDREYMEDVKLEDEERLCNK